MLRTGPSRVGGMDVEGHRDLFEQVLSNVELQIEAKLNVLGSEPAAGTILANPKVINAGSTIRQHLSSGRDSLGFDSLVQTIFEAELPMTEQSYEQLARLGMSVGYDNDVLWNCVNPVPPNGSWRIDSRSHPELIAAIEPHRLDRERRTQVYCGFGWAEIVMDCHTSIVQMCPDYRLNVIKHKWAELHFNAGPREVQEITEIARERSVETCEWCGEPGHLRELALDWTLCDECTVAMQTSDGRRGRELGPSGRS